VVENAYGSSFTISCRYVGEDHSSSISWDSKKLKINGIKTVQIVVDGTSYPFAGNFLYMEAHHVSGGSVEISSLATRSILKSLVARLISSRSATFSIELPQDRASEEFSLLGARKVLLGSRFEDTATRRTVKPGHTIVEKCVE
jgi:hypothetical protein